MGATGQLGIRFAEAPAKRATRRRLTDQERAERAADKEAKAGARARKAAGEDMPLLPELQQTWREAVAERRGVDAVLVVVTGRALSAARGMLGRMFRQVAAGRALTPDDRAVILGHVRQLFERALAQERDSFPLGLEDVCAHADRYQASVSKASGAVSSMRTSTFAQPRNLLTKEQEGPGGLPAFPEENER
jgi:hypothetical protein